MRTVWRYGIWILLFLLVSSLPGAAYEYSRPWPTGRIGLSRPDIGLRVFLGAGESLSSVQMTLNGRMVDAKWDAGASTVSYIPPAPLGAGEHKVRLVIDVRPDQPGYSYQPLVQDFSFVVQQGALGSLPEPNAEGMRALAYVSALRASGGLSQVRWDKSLGAAAGSHAQYLARNPDVKASNPHGEIAGRQGFTGETPGARARYWAWSGSVSEIIHFETTAEEAIDGWMESLYHRIPLVMPGTARLGYSVAGLSGDLVQVMKLGGLDSGSGVVLWPPPAATGVALGWSGLEYPDPLRLYGGWKGPVGYTVTATFAGSERIQMGAMELTGPDGKIVPSYRFTPENDNELADTVALIPETPLEPSTRYEAFFAGTVDGRPWERRWFFTTGTEMRPMFRTREASLEGLTLGEIRVRGYQFRPGMQIFLDGLPVKSLVVESDTSLTFRAPDGYLGRSAADLLLVTPGGLEATWPGFFDGSEGFMTDLLTSSFTAAPLFVDGKREPVDALVHPAGVLVPESALERIGAQREQIPAIGRVFWQVGGRTGDLVPGRAVYRIDGRPAVDMLPARLEAQRLYLPEGLVRGLAGQRVLVLRDISGHWAEEQVLGLVSSGVISGYEDWTFRPGEELTRGAFLKMLVTARGLVPLPGATGGFADVGGHWVAAQGWVGAAARAGIVRPGEHQGARLAPDGAIGREEMAVMIVRALGLEARAAVGAPQSDTIGDRRFADVARWKSPGHVALAVETGIITGYPESDGSFTFRPERQATRAEAAVMVQRMLQAR